MTKTSYLSRPLILRARRDTVVLVLAAVMSTFALSHVAQKRRPSSATVEASRQIWTGGLTASVLETRSEFAEPLTSASLVVPEATLALPQPPVRPLMKLRGCGGDVCVSRQASSRTAATSRRTTVDKGAVHTVAVPEAGGPAVKPRRSLMSRLNPLEHLPDAATMKRPFVYASDSVTSWFRRF